MCLLILRRRRGIMKKDQLFKLIGFFIVLAIICLFVMNNVFSVTEEALYPLFSPNSQVENIVFLIGDSMGLTQITSTRIKTVGVNGKLHMERMPATGLINTHSANSLVTDSGAAGTALATSVIRETLDTIGFGRI
jgi:alkaline phosphatase